MKNLKKLLVLIFISSLLLLSACDAQEAPVEKGPYALPSSFEYYYRLDNEETCKDSWVNKAKSGDANFAGFEIDSELINTDIHKYEEYDAQEAFDTYRIYLKTITVENYLVNIPNQTVEYIGGPDVEPSQALDPSTVLARANELAKMAPDIRIGVFQTYFPEKFDNEEWNELGIQCDPTNTVVYTIPW